MRLKGQRPLHAQVDAGHPSKQGGEHTKITGKNGEPRRRRRGRRGRWPQKRLPGLMRELGIFWLSFMFSLFLILLTHKGTQHKLDLLILHFESNEHEKISRLRIAASRPGASTPGSRL
jgi:hypothetical protein